MNELTDEQKAKIENRFLERVKTLHIKYESREYFKEQAAYFSGVMGALYEIHGIVPNAHWSISCMSDRAILEPYKL